ncbi:MAG: LysR family transcriptional regulator [Christensenellales bacterium]|jgi:DNA-binding transcriptional LysR family regulator
MRIQVLRSFIKIVEKRSFTEAASELFVTQSTLSKQVRELEKRLGQQLLFRNTRTVLITKAGQLLYEYAVRTVEGWDQLQKKMADIPRQVRPGIRIGYTTSEQLPFIQAGLSQRDWRQRGIDVSLHKVHPTRVMEALQKGETDCFILHQASLPTLKGLSIERLAHTPIHVILPDINPLSACTSLTMKEVCRLTDVRCARARDPLYYDQIDNAFRDAGLPVPKNIETGESEELEILISAPDRMSLCPSIYAPWKRCRAVPLTDCHANFDFLLIYEGSVAQLELRGLAEAIRKTSKFD